MTAQEREKLLYKGIEYQLATEPLEQYFSMINKKPDFVISGTANWRGYVGTWEISDNKLYLSELQWNKAYREKVGIKYIFPDQHKVFAYWYTGEIRIPYGKMFKYIHLDYNSIFEKELYLNIKDGVLIEEKIIFNDPPKFEDENIFYLKDD